MKIRCFVTTLLVFLAIAISLCAQDNAPKTNPDLKGGRPGPAVKPPETEFQWGVFGNFFAGVNLFDFRGKDSKGSRLTMYTRNKGNYDTIPGIFKLRELSTMYGGDVFGYVGGVGNGLLIGIGGMGQNYHASLGASESYRNKPPKDYPPTDTAGAGTIHEKETGREFAESRIHMYNFSFKVGYCLINRAKYDYDDDIGDYVFRYRWLLFPYLGLGAGGKMTQKITNTYIDDIYAGGKVDFENGVQVLNNAERIPRAEYRTFTTRSTIVELGIGTRFMKDDQGGLMLGAEMGAFFQLGKSKWEGAGGNKIENMNPTLNGLYLRATIGGGFFMPKSQPSSSFQDDGYVKPEEVKQPAESSGESKKEKKNKKSE